MLPIHQFGGGFCVALATVGHNRRTPGRVVNCEVELWEDLRGEETWRYRAVVRSWGWRLEILNCGEKLKGWIWR